MGLGTRGVGALALGLTLLGAGGCATRSADWVFDVRAANAPSRVPPGADDTVLLNIIASIITHDLGLPLPAAVPAVAYGDEASFTSGLERRGVGSERAQEAARLSSAVANGAGIFLRSDVLRGMSTTDRARLYAHELAHVAQTRLGGGPGAPMWIREGHADWVAFRVVEVLGGPSFAKSREHRRHLLLGSTTPRAQLPPLSELETTAEWVQAVKTFGSNAIYGQAFLAVDWLVERYTEEQLRSVMRSFGKGRQPRPSGAVSPVEYLGFVAEFRAYLETLQ
ncbi:MAG TPA: DUF4157 domain-containing protein [Candidatus Acidoferrum sp.]|nr:DUF4157 domain-containing protein [Candidatus Acidoferrum sp.]